MAKSKLNGFRFKLVFLAIAKTMIEKKKIRRELKTVNNQIYELSLIVNKTEIKKEEEENLWQRKREIVAILNKTK